MCPLWTVCLHFPDVFSVFTKPSSEIGLNLGNVLNADCLCGLLELQLPPIQGCPPLPPSLLAEGVAIADYGSQKMGSSDILQCQAEDDSVPKSYRSQLGISSGKLESVAMFPFAVNAIDEHSWRCVVV